MTDAPTEPPAALLGAWSGPGRVALRIAIVDGALDVEAHDPRTGRAYAVDDVRWDGEALTCAITIPRSGITLHYRARPADGDRISATWRNAARSRAELPPALRNRPITLSGSDEFMRR